MHFVEIDIPESREDLVLGRIDSGATSGADRLDGTLRIWFRSEADAKRCVEDLAPVGFPARAGRIESENWNLQWQSGWEAISVGRRWYLSPPWDHRPTPEGRIRIDLRPGVAFGNGDHATTHLCLMLMEELIVPEQRFLDVGCGSGVLLNAAGCLGASLSVGCDLDVEAVREAQTCGLAYAGSVDSVASGSFNTVVANIQLGALLRLLPEIVRALAPGGHAVLSGVLSEQAAELRDAALPWLTHLRTVKWGGWAALLFAANREVPEVGGFKERSEPHAAGSKAEIDAS